MLNSVYMKGKIDETYLSDLHKRVSDSSQSSISRFCGLEEEERTFIAVVSDPTGGIKEASDEFMPELGMPEQYLNALRKMRDRIDKPSVKSHNEAVRELELEKKYLRYIKGKHTRKLDILANRVECGEHITLVCFEKEPKWCHRFILMDEIKDRINSSSNKKQDELP